jgi:hypothetical protein
MVPAVMRRRRPRRTVAVATLIVATAAIVAVPLWRAAFGRFEGSGRLAGLVNRRPDKVVVSWSSVRSPWPGWFEVRDLRVAGRTPRVRWEVTAQRASGAIAPARLLLRELRFDGVRASGVAVRSFRFETAAAAPRSEGVLPVIPGLPEGPSPPPPADRPAWSFAFHDLAVDGIREVWVDDWRFTGSARASGGFSVRRRQLAEIAPSRLALRDLRVERAGTVVAESLSAAGDFRILPWRYPGAPIAEIARRLDGDLRLGGGIDPRAIVAWLFHGWSWLDLDGRPAAVEARLSVARGAVRPGSRLRIVEPEQRVRLFGFEAAGDAELTAAVDGRWGGARVESKLVLHRWRLGRPGEPPTLVGEDLALAARAERPRIDALPEAIDLGVDLGRARAPDLRFLDAYLPASLRARVDSGRADLAGKLTFDTSTRSGGGEIRIAASDLALEVADQRLSGGLDARLRLSEPDLVAPASFSLAGSTIRLRDFAATTAAGDRVAGWWGEVDLREGDLELGRPLRLTAGFDAKLRDTRPLVAFYDLRRDLPEWAERLLTIEGLSASGDLDWHGDRFALRRGRVPLAHGEVLAEADLAGAERRARLLLTWRRLAVGVELEGDRRDLKLVGAREWYAENEGPRVESTRGPGRD